MTRRSTQEMLPCCGCSRNVLEARDSLASTGALFLCPPGVTKRDETCEMLLAVSGSRRKLGCVFPCWDK